MNRISALLIAIMLAVILVPPALAQDGEGNTPPQITDVVWRVLRNNTGEAVDASQFALTPAEIAALPLFDPDADLAREFDILIATLTIEDPEFPDDGDQVYLRFVTNWVPFGGYLSPEGSLWSEEDPAFQPQEGDGFAPGDPAATEFEYTYQLTVPGFVGVNQARLRDLIDYDVRWVLQFSVSNDQDPDFATGAVRSWFQLIDAIENPTFQDPNPPPFADAGPDLRVEIGSTVVLDGSSTFDSFNVGFDLNDDEIFQKDDLEYTWEWLSGPVQVEPIYRDPENEPAIAEVTLNTIGTYVYRLLVSDGVNSIPTDDIRTIEVVSALPDNNAPRAVINGPDGPVILGSVIQLDGTGSTDPEGDPLTFRWRQTDELGNNFDPDDAASVFQPLGGLDQPISTWQAIETGVYYFRLLVSDGQLSDAATISIDIVESDGMSALGQPQSTSIQGSANDDSRSAPADENNPTAPAGCGTGLLPLALVPLMLWPLRRRRP